MAPRAALSEASEWEGWAQSSKGIAASTSIKTAGLRLFTVTSRPFRITERMPQVGGVPYYIPALCKGDCPSQPADALSYGLWTGCAISMKEPAAVKGLRLRSLRQIRAAFDTM